MSEPTRRVFLSRAFALAGAAAIPAMPALASTSTDAPLFDLLDQFKILVATEEAAYAEREAAEAALAPVQAKERAAEEAARQAWIDAHPGDQWVVARAEEYRAQGLLGFPGNSSVDAMNRLQDEIFAWKSAAPAVKRAKAAAKRAATAAWKAEKAAIPAQEAHVAALMAVNDLVEQIRAYPVQSIGGMTAKLAFLASSPYLPDMTASAAAPDECRFLAGLLLADVERLTGSA